MSLLLHTVTTEQRVALGWALDTAHDELRSYLHNGNQEQDHGEEWPEIARDNAKQCRYIAELCIEHGEDERWEALALRFIASAQAAELAPSEPSEKTLQEVAERTNAGNTPEYDTDSDSIPPDPDGMNEQRANAAGGALEAFTLSFGEQAGGTQQNLVDLLSDLAHMCDRFGLNFAQCIESARAHYAEETDNEGTQFDK